MKRVLIGGIGNVLLGDDGVGPYLARMLEAHYDFAPSIEVVDLGTPALDLIDEISNRDAVILIDCVKSSTPAGTVQLYRKEDILKHRPQVRMDPHSPALVEAILSAEFYGVGPKEVLLVGIVGECFDATCNLSDAVNLCLMQAAAEVLCELDRLNIDYRRKAEVVDPEIWWASAEVADAVR